MRCQFLWPTWSIPVLVVLIAPAAHATDDDSLPHLEWSLGDRMEVGLKGYVQAGISLQSQFLF